MTAAIAPRRLSAWLLCGMLAAPILFVWFFLRKGYSGQIRLAAFSLAGAMLGVNVLGRLPI